ncbi:CapA family protein [Caldisalinibacter kiritimatiensis]|uniref:Capsule biosynthesis protein capA n=1 Tax=Caldisalinibacter kiritimatiensis TaxID=1304284 RepID=R1CLR3_9FIRM|nr:CapA family protein [Caldisalinibacter kiritimatiensis]EOC99645.1 Capsule biosynthesis protein capA [Caldisalinibacter kiritimatiensis]
MKKRKIVISLVILLFLSSVFLAKFFSSSIGTSGDLEFINFNKNVKTLNKREIKYIRNPNMGKINISIAATGDIMFHTTQIISAYDNKTGTYDFESPFKPVKKYIESADIAIGNLETVTAGREHGFTGYPRFNSPKVVVRALKNTGYDILATANNHSLDRGKEGIIETIDNIKTYGLKNIGTYKTPNNDILIENVKGVKVAFLCYTYGCNGLESLLTKDELKYMINLIDEDRIKNDIEKTKLAGADFTVIFIHWGNEYHRNASPFQKQLAEKMVKWGADIILGSHPHVVQESDILEYNGENKFIIYSMGNFISNQRYETVNNRYTEDGVIVILKLQKDYVNEIISIESIEYIPTWVNRYRKDGKYKYEILPVEEYLNNKAQDLSKEVFSRMKKSFNSTMTKMDQR